MAVAPSGWRCGTGTVDYRTSWNFARDGVCAKPSHGAGDPPKAAPRHHGGNPLKTLGIEQATLDACVRESQGERVLVTRGGRPVAMVVGLADLDEDQLQLGASDKFWQLITARRKQPTVRRAELERMAAAGDAT